MDIPEAAATGRMQRVFRARCKLNEPGYISHITQRAAGKEPLFLEKSDYMTMLALLKESSEKFDLRYYAMCLMPNHVHILMEPQQKNLYEAMQSIFSRYAAKFNNKYHRRGHLFGGPYRQAVCLDNTYLLTASIYIHLNPVRAGLSETATAYPWSSSGLYCRNEEKDSFIDPDPILRLLDEDRAVARREYKRLLQEAQGMEPDNAQEQEGAIEKFCVRLAEMFPSLFKKAAKKARGPTEPRPAFPELTQLEHMIQEVNSDSSRSLESKRARKYVVEQLLARGYKKTEIAERLGIARKTVYNILHSMHEASYAG